jgi:predicted RNase H-like HicB family nuclease
MEKDLGFTMAEQIINLHVELLPEGCYLAMSEALPGMVAQGRTVAETLEIAPDVVERLHETRADRGEMTAIRLVRDCFDLALVVGGLVSRLPRFRYCEIGQSYTTIPNHPGDLPEETLRAIL